MCCDSWGHKESDTELNWVVVGVKHVLPEGGQVVGASQVVLVVKNTPVNAGDIRNTVLIPGSGRSPGGGQDNLFQYSCLQNPMDRGSLAGYSPQCCKESDITEMT